MFILGAPLGLGLYPAGNVYSTFLTETIISAEAHTIAANFSLTTTEALIISETVVRYGRIFLDTLSEALIIADPRVVGGDIYSDSWSDACIVGDTVTRSITINILEAIIQSESVAAITLVRIIEDIIASETYGIQSDFTISLTDALKIFEAIAGSITVYLLDHFILAETNTEVVTRIANLTEAIILADVLTAQTNFNVALSESLITVDTLFNAYSEILTEHTILGSSNSVSLKQLIQIQEQLITSESVSNLVNYTAALSEALILSGNYTVAQILTEALIEALILSEYIIIEDTEYMALVLNSETEALFRYVNYPFNSFNGKYAAASNGIYVINSGSDDDSTAIDAFFETGFQDFGIPNLKRLYTGYIGFTNDGSSILKVSTSDSGSKEEDWYEEVLTYDAFDTERFITHDGLRSRYWKFKLSNKDGSNLDLDTLQVYPIILQRKIR